MRTVAVDRGQERRRLKDRAFMLQVMVGAGALVLGIIVAPILARQSLGPRSSAAIALVVFGGTLGAVVVRRRMARRSVGSDVDGDG